jgi:4-hydroxyphenylpyruvate dioxygenase-like putative hemolysin
MDKPVFSAITQVSMVVDDVDAYVKRYEEYGIEPWGVMDVGPEYVKDMTSHDERVDYRDRVALCDYFDVQLELIQPLDDLSEYSSFLKENGPGIHHICLDAPDFDESLAFIKKRNGPATLLTGDSTATYYEYLDLQKDLGFRAELVKWKEFD